MTDQYSKWLELYWISTNSAAIAISKLRDYFARWGIIELLVTDSGPPFQSRELKIVLTNNGVRHMTIAPEHAQSNEAAENAVGTVKDKLKKILEIGATLDEVTNRFLLEYRTIQQTTTNRMPAEMQMNRQISTRFDVMLKRKAIKERENFGGNRNVEVTVGDTILARDLRKGQPKWQRAIVKEKLGETMVKAGLEDGSFRASK